MKLLTEDNYKALKTDAENWQRVKAGIMKANPELKAEEITPDMLLEAESGEPEEVTDLKAQLASANDEKAQKATEISQLKSEIAELKGTPAEVKQEATVNNEPTAGKENIEEFATKHEDDTIAIMQKAKEIGFF